MYTKEEVLEFVKEEDVKFIRLMFFTLWGEQKNLSIMAGELSEAFNHGFSIDGSAITGFEESAHSDLYLYPDPSTLMVIPWRPTTGKVVRMFCNIKKSDGSSYNKDVRYLLTQAIDTANKEAGLNLVFGSELEFYLFCQNDKGEATNIPFDSASYMDTAPLDKGENIRRNICFTMEQMGLTPKSSHHEAGPGQNEIDFYPLDALSSADNITTFKWIVRTQAMTLGLTASFDPAPLANKSPNSMHINISEAPNNLQGGVGIIGKALTGILRHLKELSIILNPVSASYIRLSSPNVPKIIAYGRENRSSAIRLPSSSIKDNRIQLRTPDTALNPYLAYTCLIYAALDGIQNASPLPPPIDNNLFTGNNSKLPTYDTLPETLEEAKNLAKSSEFLNKVLGKEIVNILCTSNK